MELTVEKRELAAKPKALREKGVLPAVLYGRKEASTPIAVDARQFGKVFHKAGSSAVITLKGLGEEKEALIHQVDFNVLTGAPIHADFYAIESGQTITVSVPLEFEGVSPAVRDLGGILTKVMHELEIEVLPKELPQAFHVDISKLATLEDQIQVKDLVLPPSAKLNIDGGEVVAMISVAKEEVEEAAPMDISAIGTSVERGKKEEEGEPAAEAPKEKKE